jgi:hypothetical protein
MDADIDELRSLVKKNLELTQETHRIVRGMRSAARWGRFFSVVWWLIIIGLSAASYYYFVQPYVQQVQTAYDSGKNFQQQAQDFLQKYVGTGGR